MEDPPLEPPAPTVGKLKSGVVAASLAAGDARPGGVEACSVANRSGVGEEAGRLHPINRREKVTAEMSPALLLIQFDRLKIKFLTRYYLRAITATIRTMDLSIRGMVPHETSHTLDL